MVSVCILGLIGICLVIACLCIKSAADSENMEALEIWGKIFLALTLVGLAALLWVLGFNILAIKDMFS